MTLQIEEVYRRSDQGVLKPFLCRAEDGQTYFVKGFRTGTSCLLAEFIGGHLARLMGLPVPPFCAVEASESLVAACRLENALELGPGIGFASRLVENVLELSGSTRQRVPRDLRRQVLVFDWWIQNEDRYFSESGGNPNLLWEVSKQELVVIDQHSAFSKTFDAQAFLNGHIFRDERSALSDSGFQREQAGRFTRALAHWDKIIDEIPLEWLDYLNDFGGEFGIDDIHRVLRRCELPDFWTIP